MIRFYNGRLLTFDQTREITENELWVDGDKISYIGPARTDAPVFEKEIDLKGDLLMPGMKDLHTHGAMVFLRSFADDLPLQEWLFNKVFPYEAKLTPDSIYALTKLANMEYLANGVTLSFDMYYHRSSYAQACIDSGFRTVLCGGLSSGADPAIAFQDYENFNGLHPLIGYRVGVHSEYLSNVELLRALRELTEKTHSSFWAHNSETRSETDGSFERHGCSPTELFAREGMFEYGGGGFHCVHFDENDRRIFKDKGLWAVSCPCSNAKLASGIAPLSDFVKDGVKIALGTDGAASNNALDMFREMYLASVLQKLQQQDASAMDACDILQAACCGGAQAVGLNDCDCLAPGKQADMIRIDLSRPSMQPLQNIAKNLVYSGNPGCVKMTMIAGKILYEDGQFHLDESADEIIRRAQAETDRIIKE